MWNYNCYRVPFQLSLEWVLRCERKDDLRKLMEREKVELRRNAECIRSLKGEETVCYRPVPCSHFQFPDLGMEMGV